MWCLWKKWKKGELDLELLNEKKRGKRLEAYLEENGRYLDLTNEMIRELESELTRKASGQGCPVL